MCGLCGVCMFVDFDFLVGVYFGVECVDVFVVDEYLVFFDLFVGFVV